MRVLVFGAGVIGSAYAGRLAAGGHEVALFARGKRLEDLERAGLRLRQGNSIDGRPQVTISGDLPTAPLDLIILAVRREQAMAAAEQVAHLPAGTVMLFGNFAGMTGDLAATVGPQRTVVGFPGVGGRVDGDLVTYVLIKQQPTVVGGIAGGVGAGVEPIARCLRETGIPVRVEDEMDAWLASHAALVVPIAAAITAAGGSASSLARRKDLLQKAVRATQAIYQAQRRGGVLVVNSNLRLLYLFVPEWFAVRYWSRAMRQEVGELAFAAHTRHARGEMAMLGRWLRSTIAIDPTAAGALDWAIDLLDGPGVVSTNAGGRPSEPSCGQSV
jgi:2-dehydropantoate 2-reductase